jgi:hypothetical protein
MTTFLSDCEINNSALLLAAMHSLMLIFNNGTVKFIQNVRSVMFDEASLEVAHWDWNESRLTRTRFPDPAAFPLGAPQPQVVKMEAF